MKSEIYISCYNPLYTPFYPPLTNLFRIWISLTFLTSLDHQNDYGWSKVILHLNDFAARVQELFIETNRSLCCRQLQLSPFLHNSWYGCHSHNHRFFHDPYFENVLTKSSSGGACRTSAPPQQLGPLQLRQPTIQLLPDSPHLDRLLHQVNQYSWPGQKWTTSTALRVRAQLLCISLINLPGISIRMTHRSKKRRTDWSWKQALSRLSSHPLIHRSVTVMKRACVADHLLQ